jgi:hypothetical protein
MTGIGFVMFVLGCLFVMFERAWFDPYERTSRAKVAYMATGLILVIGGGIAFIAGVGLFLWRVMP